MTGKDADGYEDRTEMARTGETPQKSSATPPGGDTWSDDPWDRTSHAREGAAIARLIEVRLARWAPAKGPARRVMVQEPEERTGGGARARLSIVLVAKESRAGALVIGWLDTAAAKIELRSYAWMEAHHYERFGRAWEVAPEEYDRLLRDMEDFGRSRQLAVTLATAPPPVVASLQPSAVGLPRWVWVAIGVAFGVLIGVAAAYIAVKG